MMGDRKLFGPSWWFLQIITNILIVGPTSGDLEISLSKRIGTLPSIIPSPGRTNLIILRMVIPGCAKGFPGNTDRIPPPAQNKGILYHPIVAALQFGSRQFAWLKQYLWNTLTVIRN